MKKVDASVVTAFIGKNLLVVACVVISLVLLVLIQSRSSLIADWQNQVAQKTDEAKRYRANLANSARLADETQALADANQRAAGRLINPLRQAENLQYFYTLGGQTHIAYSELRPTGAAASWAPVKAVKKHPYTLVNYSITASGDFPAIITYLRSLERGVYFYRLDSMTVSGAGSQATVHLNIDLLGQP